MIRGSKPKLVLLQLLVVVLMAVFLAGCGAGDNDQSAPAETPLTEETATDEAAGDPEDTIPESGAGQEAQATAQPAESEDEPAEAPAAATAQPTSTAQPAATLFPTATPSPVTPTPDAPPAPHVDVEQAAYAESECSDKYPCNDDVAGWDARMRVPAGFAIDYFARVDDLPTSLTFGPDGDLYVAARSGIIYGIDEEGEISSFNSGLLVPTGIAFQPGTDRMYVSSRVTDANVDGEGQVSVIEDGRVTTLFGGLPCCYVGMHGPNGIAFGPDGYGYVGVGGRSDHGEILTADGQGELDERHPLEASILRFAPDGGLVENYARGFRNPYDIAWDATGELYATDNGRDGDRDLDNPPDELHQVIPGGEHGYPWYDCPNCFSAPEGVEIIPPLFDLLPHSAAAGITAYHHEAFPGYYDDLFLILWSSFEGAQNVLRVDAERSEISQFATGFAQPIDLTVGPDGALYVADYATGIVFRIQYTG